MKTCPSCGNYTLGIDMYRGVIRCLNDRCRYVVTDSLGPSTCNSLYSIDNYNPNPVFISYVNSLSSLVED
jgi:hypothetical protein